MPEKPVQRLVHSARSAFAGALTRLAVAYAALSAFIVLLVGWGEEDFMGLSLAVLFASATLGIIVGFLFGVPRVAADTDIHGSVAERLVLNTNLARVSDWLTTIIIGLGLVQFRKVLEGLGWLGDQYKRMFGTAGLPENATAGFGLALTLSAFGIAFVIMFMWTSTRLLDVLKG
jgi:hypothetical protein